ncbi:MAG TPA: transglycosylase SLT domain-containing protein [candidate division Zixibacteria bacterium]
MSRSAVILIIILLIIAFVLLPYGVKSEQLTGLVTNSLYTDHKAHQVGDLLTVLIYESAQGSNVSESNNKRDNKFEATGTEGAGVLKFIPLKAVIYHESGGNPQAVSPRGAKGLMQLADSTAQEIRVKDIFDPRENILAGTKYLKSLIQRFGGDLKLALAAYNAGPSIVDKIRAVPPFKETISFVNKVLEFVQRQTQLKS